LRLGGGGRNRWFPIGRSYVNREEGMFRVVEPIREHGGKDAMARAAPGFTDLRIPPLNLLDFVPPIDGN
jgi:hypothetical protein